MWITIIWFSFSPEIQIKLPSNTLPLLYCHGKPRVHSKISAHTLKAEFHIILLDSVLWIPFELVWVVGCLAIHISVYFCFLSFHKPTCTLGASILCTPSLFSKGIYWVIFHCFFKDKYFPVYINLDSILLFIQKESGTLHSSASCNFPLIPYSEVFCYQYTPSRLI